MKQQSSNKIHNSDGSSITSSLPRGIRNNNPLNIVHGKNAWLGRYEQQDDPRFVQFAAMEYGIRAAMITIRTYINEHHCNTVESIIRRWCPDATADSYVKTVCMRTQMVPNSVIKFEDREKIIALTEAMAEVETGFRCKQNSRYIKPTDFEKAYDII